ncbi:ribulose phosphate epimerase [Nannocystaceae bacterium ST9]
MSKPTLAFLLTALACVLACTDPPASEDEAGVTTSPGTDPGDDDVGETTLDDEATATSGDDDPSTSTTSTSSTTNDDADFVTDTAEDGPWVDPCDPFAQDCPEGEKCVPYSSEGGSSWDSLKCVPVLGDHAAGEPCTYTGVVESTDDCDATSWCWNTDENGEGVCHAFCTGSEADPMCPPMSMCTISGSGVINICISTCDPVLQNCDDEALACYWIGNDFLCVNTTQDIPTGEPCGFVNDCAKGNVCVDAAMLPACADVSCCASFCEVGLGDAQCSSLPGTACVAFFEQGTAPAGLEHVGVCLLPG